jgi:hypothetical protein
VASEAVASAASSLGSSLQSVVPSLGGRAGLLRRGSSTGALSSLFGAPAREQNFFPMTTTSSSSSSSSAASGGANQDTDMGEESGWSFSGDWDIAPAATANNNHNKNPKTNSGVKAGDLFAAALKSSSASAQGGNVRAASAMAPAAGAAAAVAAFSNGQQPPQPQLRASKQQRYSTATKDISSAFKKTISCPDFSVFEANGGVKSAGSSDLKLNEMATEAERKRARRLARNRASARLRRQRKRSTIENLESKIEKVNRLIEKLRAYQFGSGLERGSALVENLGSWTQPTKPHTMDERVERTQYYLQMVCRDLKIMLNNQTASGLVYCAAGNSLVGGQAEHRAIQQELQEVLQLTPEQRGEIMDPGGALTKVGNRYTTLCALLRIAVAADKHKWMDSSIHERVRKSFTGIVSEEQDKRYMAWTYRNADAIRLLRFYRPTDDEKRADDRPSKVVQSYWRPVSHKKPLFFFGGKGSVYH